jgi:hypothetical protein
MTYVIALLVVAGYLLLAARSARACVLTQVLELITGHLHFINAFLQN